MQITQDGDQEGVATFDPENPEQVQLAMKYADVKPQRRVSEAQRRRLRRIGFKRLPPVGLAASQGNSPLNLKNQNNLSKE
jgi:hypothetical protein